MCLKEDLDTPELCPISHFLALAIADGALEGVYTVQDLKKICVQAGKFAEVVPIRKDYEEIPVLRRRIQGNHKIHPSRIMTHSCLLEHLSALGERAGYQDRLTPYSFRRGHGNRVDRTLPRKDVRHRKRDVEIAQVAKLVQDF